MKYTKQTDYKRLLYGFIVLSIAIILTLPWLGLGHFYTRGEPREALVAVAMMEQGNYILPTFQGEFAFKPPMLHWLVALFSLPQGYVSEYTARMPSAIASIAMVFAFFAFYSRRVTPLKALTASLILMTCFEVHRAAMTCRVDMVLMAFTVGSMLALYKWIENGCRRLPLLASLLASGAILTKGPIGVILPCFSMVAYLLIRQERWQKTVVAGIKFITLSAIIPIFWYIAAYHQGGEKFIQLVMEENFGRFLGKMSYESHENGIFYNVVMLLAGFVPYTLIPAFGLFVIKWKMPNFRKSSLINLWNRFRSIDNARLFAIVTAICIFVFYCIPKSKRSVYLLPMYPFTALLLSDYIIYLYNEKRAVIRTFFLLVASLAAIYSIGLIVLHNADLSFLGDSRSSRRIICQMSELQRMPINAYYVAAVMLPAFVAAISLLISKKKANAILFGSIAIWTAMTLTLDSIMNPAIKNSVPDFQFAQSAKVYQPDGRIYFYRPDGVFVETVYTVAFYLDDKIISYTGRTPLPNNGYIMVKEANKEKFLNDMADYNLSEIVVTSNEFTSFKGNLLLFEFNKTMVTP